MRETSLRQRFQSGTYSSQNTPPTAEDVQPRELLINRLAYWVAVLGIWVGLFFIAFISYFSLTMADPRSMSLAKHSSVIKVLAKDGSLMAERGRQDDHIPLEDLPTHLIDAVLTIEDRRFYYHFGIDPLSLLRAAYVNYQAGRIVQGGSTITQQLIKNLFLKPDRTMTRKIREAMLAIWFETYFSKDEILELYLNRVYFGAGAYGVEAASKRYFKKSARQLSLSEGALLAGLLKAPSRYSPTRHRKRAQARAQRVLKKMASRGLLSIDQQGTQSLQKQTRRSPHNDIESAAYIFDWVRDLLPAYIGDVQSGLVVETTIDAEMQKMAQQVIAKRLVLDGAARNVGQGAALILDNKGAVKALVGGLSYQQSQFNRAIKARRQPGSAFKPFVYLAALEAGMTPYSIVHDKPVEINGWSPKNASGKFRGALTLRDSLARSTNTVAVQLLMKVGAPKIITTAKRLGIHSKLHLKPSLALGTSEVTLLELTTAYVPFSNGGFGVLPHIIERVKTSDGKLLYERKGQGPGAIMSPKTVEAMNYMLASALTQGTGRVATIKGHTSAGKTGTSQDFRDAWFIGYTGYYTTGIWVGNDNAQKMDKVTGGTLPAQIWHDIMQASHQQLTPKDLIERKILTQGPPSLTTR